MTVTTLLPQQTKPETNFFHNADEDDTRVGSAPKAGPAEVARQGFETLMEGRDKVFGDRMAVKIGGGVLNKVLPDALKTERHARMSRPGSAA